MSELTKIEQALAHVQIGMTLVDECLRDGGEPTDMEQFSKLRNELAGVMYPRTEEMRSYCTAEWEIDTDEPVDTILEQLGLTKETHD